MEATLGIIPGIALPLPFGISKALNCQFIRPVYGLSGRLMQTRFEKAEEAIYREYLLGFTPLSLWYARTVSRREGRPISRVIARQTNLYRNSVFDDCGIAPAESYEDPRWANVLIRIEEIHSRFPGTEESPSFERVARECLWPYLEPAIGESANRIRKVIARSPFECWRYDIHGSIVKIHIANAYRQDSPLGTRFPDFQRSLLEMLGEVRSRHPEVSEVHCGSWMNSIQRFSDMFPPVWLEKGRIIQEISPGLGQWGQFMDRRGSFHEVNGHRFRESGNMPFPCIECSAGLADILEFHQAT